ncbi:MAG: heavy-metal-associated domain-containing protein [Microcoleaceae cyanobacterium]
MSIQLKVPTITCQGCVDTITNVIKTEDSDATVDVNMDDKMVTVDASMSKESIKQLITASGHEVAE